jgi:hypothetical protein
LIPVLFSILTVNQHIGYLKSWGKKNVYSTSQNKPKTGTEQEQGLELEQEQEQEQSNQLDLF